METPIDRYHRRMSQEIPPLKKTVMDKTKEIESEFKEAQETCDPHIDNGGMIYGHCTKCGVCLG